MNDSTKIDFGKWPEWALKVCSAARNDGWTEIELVENPQLFFPSQVDLCLFGLPPDDKNGVKRQISRGYVQSNREKAPVDLSWIQAVKNALEQGKTQMMITFDNCQYLVTMQPYPLPEPAIVPPAPAATPVKVREAPRRGDRGICDQCGEVIEYGYSNGTGSPIWFHVNGLQPKHPAIPVRKT